MIVDLKMKISNEYSFESKYKKKDFNRLKLNQNIKSNIYILNQKNMIYLKLKDAQVGQVGYGYVGQVDTIKVLSYIRYTQYQR